MCLQLASNLARQIEPFLNPVDLCHVSIWERARRKHLERGVRSVDKPSITFKADQFIYNKSGAATKAGRVERRLCGRAAVGSVVRCVTMVSHGPVT